MVIDSGRWPRLSALLDQALELAPDERSAWLAGLRLDAVDAGDLRRLLTAVDGGPTWIDRAGPAQAGAELSDGTCIGPFRITGILGRGGMGVVHAAERQVDDLRQQVALKLLPASLDSADRRTRFLEERRLLARLEHPGIARLIDAGVTDDDQPWFAMERVQGEPIDRHCRDHALDLRARLRLLLDVCDAVQYAHGQLIVHRDLKPSNILVGQDARPRLLDFGIAKALDDPEQTGTLWRALTPAYAAPEQIRGEPATAAGDVWSLGVLLYLLTTGRTPFAGIAGASPGGEIAAVLEGDPQPPSRAAGSEAPVPARELRGDIDAITLRALAKEPSHRYGSVDALAADLRRHLAWQPVQARRGVWSYRTGRFLRRYRLPVAIAAVAVLALAGTVLYALSEARRAQLETERSTLVKEFLIDLFELGDPDQSGQGRVDAGTLLRLGADRALGGFTGDPVLRVDLARSIAQLAGKLGDYDLGVRSLDAVLAMPAESSRLATDERASVLLDRADLHVRAARPDAAQADLDAARALSDTDPGSYHTIARELLLRARLLQDAGDFDAARGAIEQALVQDRGRGGNTAEAVARDLLALAELEHAAGNRPEAQRLWTQLLALERQRLGERHTRIADIEHDLGVVTAETGDNAAAEQHFQRAADLREALLGPGHPLFAQTLRNWGGSRRQAGDADSAETLYRRALAIYLEVLGPDHPETGFAHNSLGVLLAGRGDLPAAHEHLLLARQAFVGRQPDSPVLAAVDMNLAAIDMRLGAWEDARQGFDSALQRLIGLYGENHAQVAAVLSNQARLAVIDGRPGDALALLQRAEVIHESIYPGEHLDRNVVALGKSRILMLLERWQEAQALLEQVTPKLESGLPPVHPFRHDLATVQAAALLHQGQAEAAAELLAPVVAARRDARAGAPYAFAEAALGLARVELARGQRSRARDLIDEADATMAPEQLPAAAAAMRAKLLAGLD